MKQHTLRDPGIRIEAPTLDTGRMRVNILSCLARGLPEIDVDVPRRFGFLTIVANGPSAAELPLCVFQRPDTVAVNGALSLFAERDVAPRYWITVDPQPLVAGFLARAPEITRYLVPSHADPTVFDALADRHVRVWHAHQPATSELVPDRPEIPCGLTSTLAAIAVAHAIGYRRLEIYGWDGCFAGKRHHAVDQPFAGKRLQMRFGSTLYDTTPDWIMEAKDACDRLPAMNARIHVHGHGMIAAALSNNGVADEGIPI